MRQDSAQGPTYSMHNIVLFFLGMMNPHRRSILFCICLFMHGGGDVMSVTLKMVEGTLSGSLRTQNGGVSRNQPLTFDFVDLSDGATRVVASDVGARMIDNVTVRGELGSDIPFLGSINAELQVSDIQNEFSVNAHLEFEVIPSANSAESRGPVTITLIADGSTENLFNGNGGFQPIAPDSGSIVEGLACQPKYIVSFPSSTGSGQLDLSHTTVAKDASFEVMQGERFSINVELCAFNSRGTRTGVYSQFMVLMSEPQTTSGDLVVRAVDWNLGDGGIDFEYEVVGSLRSTPTVGTAFLYWAKGIGLEHKLTTSSMLSYEFQILEGSTGAKRVYIPASKFPELPEFFLNWPKTNSPAGEPPLGATHLLLVLQNSDGNLSRPDGIATLTPPRFLERREKHEEPIADLKYLETNLLSAVREFEDAIFAAGEASGKKVSFVVTSTRRSREYQGHLYELKMQFENLLNPKNVSGVKSWKKWGVRPQLKVAPGTPAMLLYHTIKDLNWEILKHENIGPTNDEPSTLWVSKRKVSHHVPDPYPDGPVRAVDISVPELLDSEVLNIAKTKNLHRPHKNDHVHYELKETQPRVRNAHVEIVGGQADTSVSNRSLIDELSTTSRISKRSSVNSLETSPILLLVTDSRGRRIGFDPVTGMEINEIGAPAQYSGMEAELQSFVLPLSVIADGDYVISGVGTRQSEYVIELHHFSESPGENIPVTLAEGVAHPGTAIFETSVTLEGYSGEDGIVQLNNHVPGKIDARVTHLGGTGVGDGWKAQIYAGPEGTSVSSLLPMFPITTFRGNSSTTSGYVNPVDALIPGLAPVERATLVLRVFNGASYETSLSRSESSPITVVLGGGTLPSAHLVGLDRIMIETVASPPVITSQPQSSTVSPNSSVSLSVTASGGGIYQWYKNGVTIADAVGAAHSIENAQEHDSGTYVVVVRNSEGTVTSSSALLTVSSGPDVVTEPLMQFGLGSLRAVAYSPGGTMIATVGQRGTFLWSASDGSLIRRIDGHTDWVNSVTFSPDGTQVLTGSDDQTAKLWSVSDGSLIRTFDGHTDLVRSIAFSPNGTKVLTGSDDRTAKLWSVSDGSLIRTFDGPANPVRSVAFSPDGTKILTGNLYDAAKLWSVSDGSLIRTFDGHTSPVTSVAFSPDGTKVLTGGDDQTAKLWSVSDGSLLRTFDGHTSNVNSVAFSPDGTKVLTGSHDWTAKLWSVNDGSLIRTFDGHLHWVESVAFSPDGTKVLTGSHNNTAKLWSVSDGSLIRTFDGHMDLVFGVAFSPDGTKVLTGSDDNTAKLWSVNDGSLIWTINAHLRSVTSVAFSPDGTKVLTGSGNSNAKLWSVSDGSLIRWFGRHLSWVWSVAFSPDGTKVLTGSDDWTAKLWSVNDGSLIWTFDGHTAGVTSVAFSPDGTKVLTGSDDSTARLWSVSDGSLIRRFDRHTAWVWSVAFSPDGTKVLTGSDDWTAKLWSVNDGRLIRTFDGHADGVTSAAFSPDGTKVLTGSRDNTAKLWSVNDGRLIRTFDGNADSVWSVAFSPDGTKVLTGSHDGVSFLYPASSDSAPPQIVESPQLQTVLGGSSVTFAGVASGAKPLTYQWTKDGVGLPGASTATYSIASAQQEHEGDYSLVVSNAIGSITSASATLIVLAPNTAPTISQIANQSISENGSTAALVFSIRDAESDPESLMVTVNSSNPELVADGNILLAGSGANRALTIIPESGQTGQTTISITVTDDANDTTTKTFVVTVERIDTTRPTISPIENQSTVVGQSIEGIEFSVWDPKIDVLRISVISSNKTLVPDENLSLGRIGGKRTLTVTPVSGQTGQTTVSIIASDESNNSTTITFVVRVVAPDTAPPTVSEIGPQTTLSGRTISDIAFVVRDDVTEGDALGITVSSSNKRLVPDGNLILVGSGANRELEVRSVSGQPGQTTISITVTDEANNTTTRTFVVTVIVPDATPPTVSEIGPQSTVSGQTIAGIIFAVSDAETGPDALAITVTSSNKVLVPGENLFLDGKGGGLSLTVEPESGRFGQTTISITVTDEANNTTTRTFVVSVARPADTTPPTVSEVGPQTTFSGRPISDISFSVGDDVTEEDELGISTTSSNQTLVPDGNLVLGGTGSIRTLEVTSASGQSGQTTISITVTDEANNTTTRTFVVTVIVPDATPPTVSEIGPRSTESGQPISGILFAVSDAETGPDALRITVSSSNQTLVPNGNLVLGGTGGAKILTVNPVNGQSGETTVSITVTDEANNSTLRTFVIAVGAGSSTLHPADNNPPDNRISQQELVTYAVSWKTGRDWPIGPNPIPQEYVVRAAILWKQGERYRQDASSAGAPEWWVSSAGL